MEWYQQGDVLIKPVDEVPAEAAPLARPVIGEGELTGHEHLALGEAAVVLEDGDARFLVAPHGAEAVHEEHAPVTVPAGTYRIEWVREYDHFAEEARRVCE